jgi:flagellar motor component MotA
MHLFGLVIIVAITIFTTKLGTDLSAYYNLPSIIAITLTPLGISLFTFGRSALSLYKHTLIALFTNKKLCHAHRKMLNHCIRYVYGSSAFYVVMPVISVLLAPEPISVQTYKAAIAVLLLAPLYGIILAEFILRPLSHRH